MRKRKKKINNSKIFVTSIWRYLIKTAKFCSIKTETDFFWSSSYKFRAKKFFIPRVQRLNFISVTDWRRSVGFCCQSLQYFLANAVHGCVLTCYLFGWIYVSFFFFCTLVWIYLFLLRIVRLFLILLCTNYHVITKKSFYIGVWKKRKEDFHVKKYFNSLPLNTWFCIFIFVGWAIACSSERACNTILE